MSSARDYHSQHHDDLSTTNTSDEASHASSFSFPMDNVQARLLHDDDEYHPDEYDDNGSFDDISQESFDESRFSQQTAAQLPHSSVIAIGIPAPQEEEESSEMEKRVKTCAEVDQEAVSEAIAMNMAETEHLRKYKAKHASQHTMVPRQSSLKSPLHEDRKYQGSYAFKQEQQQVQEKDTNEEDGKLPASEKVFKQEPSFYGTRRTRQELDNEADEEEDLEAQAGIPVVMPGAFAMEGMEATPGRQVTGYDSGFDNSESEEEDIEQAPQPPPAELEPPLLELEGELHQEPDLVVGLALLDDELPQEEELKIPTKVRVLQALIFISALAAIGVIVGLVVGLSRSNTSTTNENTLVGWSAIGEPLRATQPEADGSFFGSAVSLSADGTRLAVASPGWDKSASQLDIGQALVYDWTASNWDLVGQEIIGPGPRTTSTGSLSLSQTVALSKDGSRVAFGSPDWSGGYVSILQEPSAGDSDSWTPVGHNITGQEGENGRFGYSVALSSTGTTVVVGAPFADNENGETAAGIVRVYQEGLDSTWSQLGQEFMGEASFEVNGWSVAISSDGTRMAMGSPGSGVIGNFTGAVRAFRWDGTIWTQVGSTLFGDSIQDKFGHSVSMSDDGTVLAVGGWEKPDATTGGIFVGHVRIYEYEEDSNDWVQLGSDLVGSDSYDNFGYSVALSGDGMKVVVGSPRTSSISGGIAPRGYIEMYEYDGSQWRKYGGTISSTQDFDNLGHSVSISATSNRVAGGAPTSGYDGKYNNVGKVVVIEPAS